MIRARASRLPSNAPYINISVLAQSIFVVAILFYPRRDRSHFECLWMFVVFMCHIRTQNHFDDTSKAATFSLAIFSLRPNATRSRSNDTRFIFSPKVFVRSLFLGRSVFHSICAECAFYCRPFAFDRNGSVSTGLDGSGTNKRNEIRITVGIQAPGGKKESFAKVLGKVGKFRRNFSDNLQLYG